MPFTAERPFVSNPSTTNRLPSRLTSPHPSCSSGSRVSSSRRRCVPSGRTVAGRSGTPSRWVSASSVMRTLLPSGHHTAHVATTWRSRTPVPSGRTVNQLARWRCGCHCPNRIVPADACSAGTLGCRRPAARTTTTTPITATSAATAAALIRWFRRRRCLYRWNRSEDTGDSTERRMASTAR